jgi:hypothetical protein
LFSSRLPARSDELIQGRHQGRPLCPQLAERVEGKVPQHCLTIGPERHDGLPSVGIVPASGNHPLLDEPINELDHAVVPKLQSLGEDSDRWGPLPGESFHLQQQDIVLRLDARATGGHLAKSKEPADVIPELRERPVVDLRRTAPMMRLSTHSPIISDSDILPRRKARVARWPKGRSPEAQQESRQQEEFAEQIEGAVPAMRVSASCSKKEHENS